MPERFIQLLIHRCWIVLVALAVVTSMAATSLPHILSKSRCIQSAVNGHWKVLRPVRKTAQRCWLDVAESHATLH